MIAGFAGCIITNMKPPARTPATSKRLHRLLYLFPLVWRPTKENFRRRFELLSDSCCGHVFALSGSRQRGVALGRFAFYSESADHGRMPVLFARLRAQLLAPLRLLRRGDVDVIVAYDPYVSGVNGVFLKWLLGAKLVIELNGDYHLMPGSGSKAKKLAARALMRTCLKVADVVKVLNSDQEAFVRREFPGKVVYRFSDFVADGYFRSLDHFKGDYLLSVGFPFELKGVAELIEAFKLLGERSSIKLRIMGHCPPEDLVRWKALAGDDSRIEFVPAGWIEDVGEQMRGCYALVNAAHFEAMGRVHLEAMACRKPIVATRTNGAIECIVDGETGLICEIGNAADLARKLDAILSDPALAERMGDAGFERLEANYSERRYISNVREMLEVLDVAPVDEGPRPADSL